MSLSSPLFVSKVVCGFPVRSQGLINLEPELGILSGVTSLFDVEVQRSQARVCRGVFTWQALTRSWVLSADLSGWIRDPALPVMMAGRGSLPRGRIVITEINARILG